MTQIETLWRGASPDLQLDFHLSPEWVEGGDEKLVLVRNAHMGTSGLWRCTRVQSFLGVMPGDVVEMAVDVVADDGRVFYVRSVHKECAGIYDAWHTEDLDVEFRSGVTVTLTCRVNGPNRAAEPRAFFEGLVRLWLR